MKLKKGEKVQFTHKETGETEALVVLADVDTEKQPVDFRDDNGDMRTLSHKEYEIKVMSKEEGEHFEAVDSFANLPGVISVK